MVIAGAVIAVAGVTAARQVRDHPAEMRDVVDAVSTPATTAEVDVQRAPGELDMSAVVGSNDTTDTTAAGSAQNAVAQPPGDGHRGRDLHWCGAREETMC